MVLNRQRRSDWMEMGMVRVILAIALAFVLSACSLAGATPEIAVVERAIALQLNQTQEQLSQQLRLDTQPAITVNRIRITDQTPLTIQDLQSYRVKGTCSYTVKLSKRSQTQQQAPFEVYLQRQQEGKNWRLAYPDNKDGKSSWITYRIPTGT